MDITITTKMKILKQAHEVFEAFVDPEKIKNFWFSGSSARWEENKIISLEYLEYGAKLDIEMVEVIPDKKIVFKWGENGDEHLITIIINEIDKTSCTVKASESGWKENTELVHLLGNKEGWVFMLTCLKAYMENGIHNLRVGLVG